MHTLQPLVVVAGPPLQERRRWRWNWPGDWTVKWCRPIPCRFIYHFGSGTARPTAVEMEGIPHHLLGFLPLCTSYSVAQYAADAHAAIARVGERGRLPILCGGTGLYIQAVTDNLVFPERAGDPALRAALRGRAETEGGEGLLEELRAVDPDTAGRLHPHDIGRIVRALEVYAVTGRTITEQNRLSRRDGPRYRCAGLLLDFRDRQILYDRIGRRVDRMLEQGLLEEAERVLSSEDAPTAMQAIGYKELAPYFRGEIPLSDAVEKLKQETRRVCETAALLVPADAADTVVCGRNGRMEGSRRRGGTDCRRVLAHERRTLWIPSSNV